MELAIKRIISICLITILTLPLIVTANENNNIAKGTKGIFHAISYPEDAPKTDNIFSPFSITNYMARVEGPMSVAKDMVQYMRQLPEGKRGVHPYVDLMLLLKQKAVSWWWLDKGADEISKIFDQIFYYYKRLGGPDIDYLILDYEYQISIWHLQMDESGKVISDEMLYKRFQDIIDDPRYKTEIRPQLEEMGFEFCTDPKKNELYYMYENLNKYPFDSPEQKNVYIGLCFAMNRMSDCLTACTYDVAKKYFPNIKCSNYNDKSLEKGSSYKELVGLVYAKYAGPTKRVGTHSSSSFYGTLKGKDQATDTLLTYEKFPPEGYPFKVFNMTNFNICLDAINKYQYLFLQSGGKVQPWIGGSRGARNASNILQGEYYKEMIYHMGLGYADPFLYYNDNYGASVEDDAILSSLLHELDEVAGFSDRKSLIKKAIPMDSRYILTGMYAGGKNIWRITPDLCAEGVTMENFVIDKDKPTFKIGNQFVEFPEGSFIYQSEENHGSCGYWVISPTGTEPTEYRDETLPILPEAAYRWLKDKNKALQDTKVLNLKSYKDLFINQN